MARHVELCEDCKEGSRMKTSDNHGRVPPMFAASQRRYCAGGLSAGFKTPAPRPSRRLLFSALFSGGRARPPHKTTHHHHGPNEPDHLPSPPENISEDHT